jgi:glycosyltransferase involved in cell wall biosynthesis
MGLVENTIVDDRTVRVSVIIPAYNCAKTLGAQLDALRTQATDFPWEIIVVDNGSTDETVPLVQRHQKTAPNLILVHATEKKSTSYGRNVGASNAHGDILLFCDGDDIVAPGWLSAMARALERHEFVVGRVEVQKLNSDVPEKYGNNGLNDKAYHFLPYAIGCTMGVTRRAFESVGGFSTMCTKCMDVDLSWRLQLAGYSLHEVPEAEVYYRYRTTAWSHWKTAFSFSQAHVALYKRFAVHGAKRSPIRQALRRYKKVLSRLPNIARMTQRERIVWASELGVSLGRIWGSLRYRTLYL